jgi:hypothetical protein
MSGHNMETVSTGRRHDRRVQRYMRGWPDSGHVSQIEWAQRVDNVGRLNNEYRHPPCLGILLPYGGYCSSRIS